jgi:hypothetical protein
VTEGIPQKKPRRVGGNMTIRKDGSVVHTGGELDTKVNPHKRLAKDGSLVPHKNVRITGDDLKHAKDILKDHFPKTAEKAAENIERQDREQREGEWVKFQNEMKLRMSQQDAARAVGFMSKALPRGAPSTRPTFQMPGYFKTMPDGTRRLVRAGDPDY